MKVIKRLQNKWESLMTAVDRFPLTMVFLLAIAVVRGVEIQQETSNYSTYLYTFIIGAMLSAVAQLLYERFFRNRRARMLSMGGAIVLTLFYYVAIGSVIVFSTENWTKTAVMLFALTMVFIWVPSIKSEHTFNESFMSTFKAFFITVLFTGVIAVGVSSIIVAIDQLLFTLGIKTTAHALNFIFSLFAPIFFLSLIPRYPGKQDVDLSHEEKTLRADAIQKATRCPKYLEVLLSYVIIPLTAVYTLILLIYVLLNIRAQFWTESALEPLLVSYAITVILVYVLASTLDNPLVTAFRNIFPKVLVPIVLFQTTASTLKIADIGVTHGRYYVIMFGVFAFIASLVFSFMPPKRNGWIAVVLIVFATISIIPPIDAFTVSRVHHVNTLEKTLVDNRMLENGKIVQNADVSQEDKITITETLRYLDRINYTDEIVWLPDDIFYDDNFKETFGFAEADDPSHTKTHQSRFAYLDWEKNPVLDVQGHDVMVHLTSGSAVIDSEEQIPFEANGKTYTLLQQREEGTFTLRVQNENNTEQLEVTAEEMADHIFGADDEQADDKWLTVEKAAMTKENADIKMTILVQSFEESDSYMDGEFYIFIDTK